MCPQVEIDFKLVLKLQQQEMESPNACEFSPCPELITWQATSGTITKEPIMNVNSVECAASERCITELSQHLELQFEANAVAALLELQRRSSK